MLHRKNPPRTFFCPRFGKNSPPYSLVMRNSTLQSR